MVQHKDGQTERILGMFLSEKEPTESVFALPGALFTRLLYRSREVSSECSGTIEHIFQSPVSKGVQTQGLGPGSVSSAMFQGHSFPVLHSTNQVA